MGTKASISGLNTDHRQWLNHLSFYKDELNVLDDRLSEIALKHEDRETLAWVNHFHNQFIVQRDEIEKLVHNIRIHDRQIETTTGKLPRIMYEKAVEEYEEQKEEIERFEILFDEMKDDLCTVLSDGL